MDCSTWWFDHVGEMYIYVLATRMGNSPTQEDETSKLIDGASSWGDVIEVPEASNLMTEHVAGAKSLADSAFAKNQEAVDQAVNFLLANLDRQTEIYKTKIPGFPSEEWTKLFSLHISATGGYILALAAGDMDDFRAKYNQVLKNRNDLARFWGRVAMQTRR